MRLSKKISLFVGLISVLLLSSFSSIADNTPILLPDKYIEGRLPNGLRYIIKNNDTPFKRTEFRLVMSVGANQEREDQRGIAHYLEHMAFGGTKNFPNNKAVTYLESLGMKYGRDINAVTGYDKTIYMFAIPSDKENVTVIDTSLMILKDWLTNINFHEEDVENECGIILEELRGYDVGDKFYDLKIGNNIFSKRMPLGNEDEIKAINKTTLSEFYEKWYQPNLACLIIVGDINPKEIESKIKKEFSSIPSKNTKEHIFYPLTYAKGVQIEKVVDTLISKSKLDVMIPYQCVISSSKENIYNKKLENLLVSSLGKRFSQLDGLNVQFFDTWYLSNISHFGFNLQSDDSNELLNRVENVAHEFSNILKYGFLPEEVEEAKKDMIEKLKVLSFSKTSSIWCDDFTDYFMAGDRYISNVKDNEWLISKIEKTQPSELSVMLKKRVELSKESLLLAFLNNKEDDNLITSKSFEDSWTKGLETTPKQRVWTPDPDSKDVVEVVAPILEVKHKFDPKLIESIKTYPNMGVTRYTLTNGIALVLKPTLGDAEKKLMVTSISPGGSAWIVPEKHHQLEGVAGYMELGGIEALDYDTYSDYMYQENLSLILTMENHWHGLMGAVPSENSNLLFNLMYQKIVNPELCYKDFKEIKKDLISNIDKLSGFDKMLKHSPGRLLLARMGELMGESVGTVYSDKTKKEIKSLNLDDIASFYNSLYSTTENSIYIFTGNFDINSVVENFVSVFGKLPKKSLPKELIIPSFSFPTDNILEGFEIENKNQTVLSSVYYGNYTASLKGSLTLKLMRDLVRSRLLSILREQESLVYSPYVFLTYSGCPYEKFHFEVNVSMGKENANKVSKLVDQIFNDLAFHKVSNDELDVLKRSFLVTKRESLTESATSQWKDNLTTLIKNGENLEDFDTYANCLNNITSSDIQQLFEEIQKNKHVVLYQGEYDNKELRQKPAYKLYDNKGCEVDYDTMIDYLVKNDVVFIGEYHNCSIAHWLQLEIVKSLSDRLNKKLTLGFEMLECDNQLIVDEYISGLISEERYLAEARLWPNYKLDYAPIVNFAKDNSLPVVATNIPRRYARAVYENGLKSLENFPIKSQLLFKDAISLIDTTSKASHNFSHMKKGSGMVRSMGSKMDSGKVKRLTQAQAIKDAVMASNIAKNAKQTFVHINGNLHSDKNEGIIAHLLKVNYNLKITNITTVYQDDISILEKQNANKADFYIVVPSNTHKSF